MTYYEWVSYLDELINKPITDDVIKKINTYDFKFPQDTMARLETHILRIMFDKLRNIRESLENDLNKVKSPQELQILVNKIKDTIKEVSKIQKVKYFDTALVNELKSDIEKFTGDYESVIKKHYKGISTNEYAMIINNMRLLEDL